MDLLTKNWTKSEYNSFVEYLKTLSDEKYQNFHSMLVNSAKQEYILGIRMPSLRDIGKQISKGNPKGFLTVVSNDLYEERMIKGIVIGLLKPQGFEELTELCDDFVNDIDNWALCDCFCSSLKQVKKYKEEFFEYIVKYLISDSVWQIRFGLVIMLNYYLDDEHIKEVLFRCDLIKNDFYYVKMAQAWLVATALAKCRDITMDYIKENSLDKTTFNLAVQKAVESKRIDDADKVYLKSLKKLRTK